MSGPILLALLLGTAPTHRFQATEELKQELTAARAEGLWTTPEEIRNSIACRPDQNSAPLIKKAIQTKWTRGFDILELGKILKGTATDAEKKQFRQRFQSNPQALDLWRKASQKPKLDFGRNWKDGAGVLEPELADLKQVSRFLCAAAALGIDPRENLLTAARIGRLCRQEATVIGELVWISIGKYCLQQAEKHQLVREVDATLGPPADFRAGLRSEMVGLILVVDWLGTPEWNTKMGVQSKDFGAEGRTGTGWKPDAKRKIVAAYRGLWHSMPKNPSDYTSAQSAYEKWSPALYRAINDASEVLGQLTAYDEGASQMAASCGKFEALRKSYRQKALQHS